MFDRKTKYKNLNNILGEGAGQVTGLVKLEKMCHCMNEHQMYCVGN